MNRFDGIAVAGTHGKTTTSSMMSVALLEKEPFIVVGGIIPEIQSNSKIGNSEYFIAEADESDNSFLYIKPKYSVVTNVEADHLDHHGTFENIKKSFEQFIDSTERIAVLCKDTVGKVGLNLKNKNVVWYSIKDETADIFAKNIRVEEGITSFEVVKKGEDLGTFSLSIPGEHNVANSLPVIYFAHEFNCNMKKVKERILKFKGAKRRYQVIYDNNLRIIDDYAHHPTEIKATLSAAQNLMHNRIWCLFQPHTYTRTLALFDDFIDSFKGADILVLTDIYAAREKDIYNISSDKLAERIKLAHPEIEVVYIKDFDEIASKVLAEAECDDLVITMGAGDIYKVGQIILEKGQA